MSYEKNLGLFWGISGITTKTIEQPFHGKVRPFFSCGLTIFSTDDLDFRRSCAELLAIAAGSHMSQSLCPGATKVSWVGNGVVLYAMRVRKVWGFF